MGKRNLKAGIPAVIAAVCGLLGILFLKHTYIVIFCFVVSAFALLFLLFTITKWRNHPVGRILYRIVDVLACVFLAASILTGGLIVNAAAGTEGEFRYLIVLGCDVNGTEPSPQLQSRIDAAADYLSAHPDVMCILSGGKADAENISEAQCMYNGLSALDIGSQRLILEDRATTTAENIAYAIALIEQRDGRKPDSVGLVSSEYHLYRANMFAQQQNVAAVLIPAKTDDTISLVNSFLREIVMVWYYSTIG